MSHVTSASLLLTCLTFVTPAHGLQCHDIVPDSAFEAASRVVIAQLRSKESVADSDTKFRLIYDVVASLKGRRSETIEMTLEKTPWVDPGHYAVGVQYLWFLEEGQVEIGVCEKILVLEGRAARWYALWREKNAR